MRGSTVGYDTLNKYKLNLSVFCLIWEALLAKVYTSNRSLNFKTYFTLSTIEKQQNFGLRFMFKEISVISNPLSIAKTRSFAEWIEYHKMLGI